MPTQVLLSLKRSYLCFSIYKAFRKVLFLVILDQRSYKGLIFNAAIIFKRINFLSKHS